MKKISLALAHFAVLLSIAWLINCSRGFSYGPMEAIDR